MISKVTSSDQRPPSAADERILRLAEVIKLTSLKRTAIYAAIARGKFPPPFRIVGGRARGWWRHEVLKWLRENQKEDRS